MVDSSATVGPNVTIGPGARVGPGARIKDSILLDGVVVGHHSKRTAHCRGDDLLLMASVVLTPLKPPQRATACRFFVHGWRHRASGAPLVGAC